MAAKSKSTKLGAAMPSPMSDMDWRAKDALRTLTEAEKIRKDAALMRAVKAESKAQMKALETVCKPNGKK